MSGQINGLNCSTSSSGGTTTSIDSGTARDSGDTTWITIPATQTRGIDLSTNGAGGLDTGSVAANTVYAIYVMDSSGVVSGIASTSFSAPSGIGTAKYRRVGALCTNGSAKVIEYTQTGANHSRSVTFSSDPTSRRVVTSGSSATYTNFPANPPGSPQMTSADVHVDPSAGGTTWVRANDGTGETSVTSPTTVTLTMPTTTTWGNYKTSAGSTTTLRIDGFDESV